MLGKNQTFEAKLATALPPNVPRWLRFAGQRHPTKRLCRRMSGVGFMASSPLVSSATAISLLSTDLRPGNSKYQRRRTRGIPLPVTHAHKIALLGEAAPR